MANKSQESNLFIYLIGQDKLLTASDYTTFQEVTISYTTASLKLDSC
jgi:hypothetical protein